MKKGINFLVTGATGLLGCAVSAFLADCGDSVFAVAHRHRLRMSGITSAFADLTDPYVVQRLIETLKPSHVVHCAATTNVDWCEANPQAAVRINVEMSANLAHALACYGGRMIYISTDSVFDGKKGHYTEQDAPAPLNVYAKTKLQGEIAVHNILGDSVIVRTNIHGWNVQEKMSLSEWALARLRTSESIDAFDDIIFSPLLVNDLAQILRDIALSDLSGLFHVGSQDACSKFDFMRKLAVSFNYDPGLVKPKSIDSANLNAPRPKNTSLDSTLISRLLWRQLPTIAEGIDKLASIPKDQYMARFNLENDNHVPVSN